MIGIRSKSTDGRRIEGFERAAIRTQTETKCGPYGAGHVPVVDAAIEATSSSRNFRSLLATSMPFGGAPAVAPPVGVPAGVVAAALSLPVTSTRLPTKSCAF